MKKNREICGCHGACAKHILNEEEFFCIEDMGKSQKSCACKKPILQPQTKQCGRCLLYIDRVRHIRLTHLIHAEIEQNSKRRRIATILAIILATLILLLA